MGGRSAKRGVSFGLKRGRGMFSAGGGTQSFYYILYLVLIKLTLPFSENSIPA